MRSASERSVLGLGGSMTNSEGAIVGELTADQLIIFYQLCGGAFTVPQQNFPPLMHGHTAGNDDHTDAYWRSDVQMVLVPYFGSNPH